MKYYSLLIKPACCALVVCCTSGLMHSPSYAQGRTLTAKQIDAIVTPSLSQCEPPIGTTKFGRVDPNSIIPTNNAQAFPTERIARTLEGVWRGQVIGDPNDPKYDKHKEGNVDYFWLMDLQRNEGLIIAQRGTGKQSTAQLKPVAAVNPPKISYLICPHEGYLPAMERGSEIHEFVKVSDNIKDATQILTTATGVKFRKAKPTLSDMWQQIVASGYFQSLPAVAFAGALFKIQLKSVPGAIESEPAQISLAWSSEYYGGGTTWLKFTPGVPMVGFESGQFVGTRSGAGDFLVASPGNGKLWKVEAKRGGDYDLAFDSVTLGPLLPAVEPARQPARPKKKKK
jgi:hypothetical protein